MSRAVVRTLPLLLAVGLSAIGTLAQSPDLRSLDRTLTHAFNVETVADGLINPWSIAFLPNGDILVTERPGRLRSIRNGVLDPLPIPGVPAVLASGQGGLLDVALHPAFATNRLLYLSLTRRAADGDRDDGGHRQGPLRWIETG